jgi:TM2 domain-containing membrane protein YozV
MANMLMYFPTLEPDELVYVQSLLKDMSDEQIQQYAGVYNSRRKDAQTVLITTLLGFLGFAGIQRFLLGQIGMGILFFFTGGLCLIGTIVDLVNYKKLAFDANTKIARETLAMVRNVG